MAEDQRELGQVSPVMRVFLEHAVFSISKELDRLLAFANKIVDEDFEVFVFIEKVNPVFILGDDQSQMLIRVGENVQNIRRRVLQILRLGRK